MAEHRRGGYPSGDATVSELPDPPAAAPPPLTLAQMRYFLEQCSVVVKPGETLALRLGREWTPAQMREVQEMLDGAIEHRRLSFRVLVVPGDDLGVVQDGSDAAFARRVATANADLAVHARFPRRPLR